MKLLHTSDWHLGKKLLRADRLPEQAKFLKWLLSTIVELKVDGLLIAGDIFDTPNPPYEAQKLYFDFLHELSELKIKTFIISGNHDSGALLDASKEILSKFNVHISGQLSMNPEDHVVHLDQVSIVTLPYFRNYELYNLGKIFNHRPEDEHYFTKTLEDFLKRTSDLIPATQKKVLLGHHLFGFYSAAGSEAAISLSGIEAIPLSMLENKFDYVAIGHIHKPQIIKKENPIVYYSGSPIPMRFSEKENKTVSMITIQDHKLTQEILPIPQFRLLRSYEINEEQLDKTIEEINLLTPVSDLKNLIEINLKLKTPQNGLVDQIRAKLNLDKNELLTIAIYFEEDESTQDNALLAKIKNNLDLEEMFGIFYQHKFNQNEVPAELRADFHQLLDKVNNAI